jgi:DNA-directed RNA polymerase specialized sigma subunit
MSIERDKEIYTARVIEKRTLQAIADKYNLSRQRVYQIVSQQKELVDHTKDWKKPYRPEDGN